MSKRLMLLFMIAVLCRADDKILQLYYVGGLLTYTCEASSQGPTTSVSVAAGTATNIVVSSNVGTVTVSGHSLPIGARVSVSGSSTSALNGTYTVTLVDANSYTIVTSGVSNGTYTTGIVISTTAPLLNSTQWKVSVLHYASGVLDANYVGGPGASSAYKARCTDRTTY